MTNTPVRQSQLLAFQVVMAFFVIVSWALILLNTLDISRIKKDTDTLEHRISSVRYDSIIEINDLKKELKKEDSIIRNTVYEQVNEIKLAKSAKIYTLKITICKENKNTNEIEKRYVMMSNVVWINPSVDRTAIYVDVGINYDGVPIPTILDDETSYACWLKILSIR